MICESEMGFMRFEIGSSLLIWISYIYKIFLVTSEIKGSVRIQFVCIRSCVDMD